MTSSNNFSALKCVLLDKSLSKVINSFLPPQQVYPDIQKKKDKVINSLNKVNNRERLSGGIKCKSCKTSLSIWWGKNKKSFFMIDDYFYGFMGLDIPGGCWCSRCAIKYYDNISFRSLKTKRINYRQLKQRVENCYKAGIYL